MKLPTAFAIWPKTAKLLSILHMRKRTFKYSWLRPAAEVDKISVSFASQPQLTETGCRSDVGAG